MATNILTVPSTIPRKLNAVKRRLRRADISLWQISQTAKVSDSYVWMVLNGRRRSPRVMATIDEMLVQRKEARRRALA